MAGPRELLGRVGSLARREFAWLAALLAVAGGLSAFAELADEVMEGDTRAFDTAILLALREASDASNPIGPGWVEEMGRDFTALGGVGVLTLLTLGVAGFLLMQGKRRATALVLVSVSGGLLLSTALKAGFDRPRPDLVPHGSVVYTASFPSGHSMMAAVTYLTLGVLLARFHGRRDVSAYVLGASVLITALVGVSRVYLGVHWPTDVLAGWTAGALWAGLVWAAALALQRRGAVEAGPEAAIGESA